MNNIAIFFSGQGAQSAGMGHDIYNESAEAKALFDMGESIRPGTLEVCFGTDGAALTLTENAQPALFLTGLAFARELSKAGINADSVAGFSLGEIPALAYSGILSDEEAFRLVIARSHKMSMLSNIYKGGMVAALKLDNKTVEDVCSEFTEVWPVNYNCPGQLSCAGNPEQLDGFIEKIKAAGGRAVKIPVSGAFHTPYMAEAGDVLRDTLKEMTVNPPEINIYSNCTGEVYPDDVTQIVENIAGQVSSPVRWEQIIRKMNLAGIDTFIEVGAGATLTGFVKRTLSEAKTYTVTDVASLRDTIAALSEGR